MAEHNHFIKVSYEKGGKVIKSFGIDTEMTRRDQIPVAVGQMLIHILNTLVEAGVVDVTDQEVIEDAACVLGKTPNWRRSDAKQVAGVHDHDK